MASSGQLERRGIDHGGDVAQRARGELRDRLAVDAELDRVAGQETLVEQVDRIAGGAGLGQHDAVVIWASCAAAWCRACASSPPARVVATRLGMNLPASTVPQPEATSKPLAAAKPGTPANELFPLTTSAIPLAAPARPIVYKAGLTGPMFALLTWVASASTPANSGEASDVPSCASMVMSGTERIGLPVTAATLSW